MCLLIMYYLNLPDIFDYLKFFAFSFYLFAFWLILCLMIDVENIICTLSSAKN